MLWTVLLILLLMWALGLGFGVAGNLIHHSSGDRTGGSGRQPSSGSQGRLARNKPFRVDQRHEKRALVAGKKWI